MVLLLDLNASPPDEFDGGKIPGGGEAEGDRGGGDGPDLGHFDVNFQAMDEDAPEIDAGAQPDAALLSYQQPMKHKWVTNEKRFAAYAALYARSNNGVLKKNSTKQVAEFFETDIQVIQRIWRTAKRQIALGQEVDVSHKKTGRCGRRKIEVDLSKMTEIPLNRRSSFKSLSEYLHVSIGTLHRKFKLGEIRRHSNTLKPYLREQNKRSRLQYCLSMLDPSTLGDVQAKFIDMQNIVHIDEKWFNMTKKAKKFYFLPEEDDPLRTVQNKKNIGKVMFLTALARPRFDEHGNVTFSRKLGLWTFVKEVPSARRSANRPRGTLETISIIVNKDIMREYLIQRVIPTIKAAWPLEDVGKAIFIQQDNARTHIDPNDEAFLSAVAAIGLDIHIMHQPPNSPDFNILDLGFFSSIQSLTYKRNPSTIQDLIRDVDEEFEGYEVAKVNRVYLTLQTCMLEVMRIRGGNGYKIPHMNKQGLEREGRLPSRLSCDVGLYESVVAYLGQDARENN